MDVEKIRTDIKVMSFFIHFSGFGVTSLSLSKGKYPDFRPPEVKFPIRYLSDQTDFCVSGPLKSFGVVSSFQSDFPSPGYLIGFLGGPNQIPVAGNLRCVLLLEVEKISDQPSAIIGINVLIDVL
jgi:hypothetical protein